MIAILLIIITVYFTISLFGYVVHWALHQPWAGKFNKAHMTHHLVLYPKEDFASDSYRSAGQDSSAKFFIIAAIPLILTPILLGIFGILSVGLVIVALVAEGIMGFLNNYLHDAFHIKNHILNRIPIINFIFAELVQLHYLHHVDMNTNYGIFSFHWDRLFKTFWNDSSVTRP